MRLKLNRTLRAALIAAVATVGFTLPQSFAEQITLPGASDFTWIMGNQTNIARNDISASSIQALATKITAASVDTVGWFGGTGQSQGNNGEVRIGEGGSFIIKSRPMYEGEYVALGTDLIQDATSVTLTFNVDKKSGYSVWIYDSANSTATQVQEFTSFSGTSSVDKTWDVTGMSGDTLFVVWGSKPGNNEAGGTDVTISSITLAMTSAVKSTQIWAGVAGTSNWSDAAWDSGVTFTEGNDAVFDSTAASHVVGITSTTRAGIVTVSDTYEFNLAGGSLSAAAMTIAADKTLSITGTGTVKVSNALTKAGTLSLASGVNMTAGSSSADASGKFALAGGGHLTLDSLDMGSGATQTLAVSDNSTLTVGGTYQVASGKTLSIEGTGLVDLTTLKASGGTINVTSDLKVTGGNSGQGGDNQKGIAITGGSGTVNINAGTTTVTGAVYSGGGSTGTLNVGTVGKEATLVATRLEFGDTNSGGSVSRINIGADGTVVVTSANNDATVKTAGLAVAEWNQNTEISVDGKLYAQSTRIFAHDGLMTLKIQNNGIVAVKGITADKAQNNVVTLAGNGKLVLGDTGITSGQGTWNITLNGGEVGITADTEIARAINVAGAVTFNTDKYVWENNQTLTQGEAAGTITVSGNITGTGTITKTGTGELILSGTGNALTHTLQIKEGQLTLNGSIAIDGIKDGELEEGFVNASDEKTTHGNGFAYKAGTMNVYSLEGDAQFVNNGSFTINGETVAVTEEGKYVLSETVDKTTLYVNEDSANFAAYKEKAVDELSKVVLAADASVNMDYDAASITLVMHGNATVNATAATTISGVEGWSNNTLTIIGEDTVTLSGGDLSLAGTQKLDVRGSVVSGTISVSEAGAGLSVAEDATLAVTGRLNAKHGDVTINGALTLTDALDLGCDGQSDVVLTIGSTGSVTANSIMYMNTAASVKMLAGGEFSIGGLTFTGKVDDGTITATARGQYSTNRAENKITNATVTVTGEVTLGNTLEGVDVVVAGGGTLTLSETAVANSVTVDDGGTIAGGVDASQVGIAADATATFAQGITDASGVMFSKEGGVEVKNTNEAGGESIHYGIAETNAKVTADELAYTGAGENTVVANQVAVDEILNYGEGPLTLTHVDTETLQSVGAYMGDVTLQNVGTDAIVLKDITLLGTTVAVYQAEVADATQEGTVTITETLVAGSGTLLANLILDGTEGHVELNLLVAGSNNQIAALTLGSQFGIAEGTLVTLDDITICSLEDLAIGGSLDLIKAKTGTELTYLDPAYDGMWFGELFERTEGVHGDYRVYATGESFGLTKVSNTPEPTTGTLSLLALMALAARRRRK